VLELRPTCEHGNKVLPPNSLEARICSYECTFCVMYVEQVLGNVCPIDPIEHANFSADLGIISPENR